ncbi:glycosyl transferase, family 3 [Burkholderia cenocepacia H111]|nr:glycosyl transferase, family 3 [Burkholderia cenocepacia H111]
MSLVVVFGRQRHGRGAAGARAAGNQSVARHDARPRPCDTRDIPHRSPRGPMPAARPTFR